MRTDTIQNLTYDAFGHVLRNDRGGTVADMTYSYDHMHGWLKSIKSGGKFEQKLFRETDGNTPCYNGNISAMTWRTGNDYVRRFDYEYNGMNWLTDAAFSYYSIGNPSSPSPTLTLIPYVGVDNEDYTCQYYYDKNGNLTGAYRQGLTDVFDEEPFHDYDTMDDYNVEYYGNQKRSVNYEGEGSPYYYGSSSFVDGLEDGDNEYAYNPNGAMTMDLNKGITDISYDLLNNISEITFSNNRSIRYVYAADGTRLRTVHSKRVGNSYVKDSTDYVGNLVMKNGQPGMYQFAGGYLSFANSLLSGCHYYIQDYQGSNRMVVNKTGTVEQITHYYPYGGIIGGIDSSPNLQQYKFEGKELDRTYGLDWYDIHARQYDPVVPSWHAIDPMSEKYYGISPYAYCANNPVRYVDPDGKEIIDMLPAQTEGQEISKQKFFNRWHDNSNSIILMGHGGDNGKSFITTNSSIDVKIFANNLYGMAYFLEDNSQTWNISSIASDKVELVLFSCDTGSYNGLAEDLSKQDDFQDISIFAPSNAVNINPDGSVSIDNDGVWREYVNGQVVNEYSGNTVPGTREFNTSTTWEKTPQNISWQK